MNTKFSSTLAASTTLTLILTLTCAPVYGGTDGSGLQVSASVDITGSFKVGDGKDDKGAGHASDRLDVREAEVTLYGPIDHLFDGVLSLAAHREQGVASFEIHETHISTSKLIARSRIKAGQFFPSIGRLNRQHRHEWPFISAPKVQTKFFGSEGLIDTGVEYGYLTPLPFFLDVTAGITNGWVYGHAHDEGSKPKTPMHFLRMATYSDLPHQGGFELGLNGVGRTDSLGNRTSLVGIDAVAKWRDRSRLTLLIQGEAWHRDLTPNKGDSERSAGTYLFPQAALTEACTLGIRFDYFAVLSLKDAAGARIANKDQSIVPTLTFKPSEFSTFRASYTHREASQAGTEKQVDRMVEVQMSFSLGAHPAHAF